MYLLFSANQYSGIIDVDTEDIFISAITSKKIRRLLYGMSWDKDFIYAAYRRRRARNKDNPSLKGLMGWITVTTVNPDNGTFDFKRYIKMPREDFVDVHQMQVHNGKIWATCTGLNTIAIIDPKDGSFIHWLPNKEWSGSDLNHFNSLFFDQENKVYITAHNNSFKSNNCSQIYIHDTTTYEQLDLIELPLYCSHNVVKIGSTLFIGDTNQSSIAIVEDREIVDYIKIDENKWLRGIAISEDMWAIGVSPFTESNYRESGDGKVVLTGNDFKQQGEIYLPSSGQIYELRWLDVWDHAHPVGPFLPTDFNPNLDSLNVLKEDRTIRDMMGHTVGRRKLVPYFR
tara:strand:- start:638 stop:1663 length:1026 start_codon:yes stop_codon:yes gene_type:complete